MLWMIKRSIFSVVFIRCLYETAEVVATDCGAQTWNRPGIRNFDAILSDPVAKCPLRAQTSRYTIYFYFPIFNFAFVFSAFMNISLLEF